VCSCCFFPGLTTRSHSAQLAAVFRWSLSIILIYDFWQLACTYHMMRLNQLVLLSSITSIHRVPVKDKVIPVIKYLKTTPWRRMGEWMYRSIYSWPRHYWEWVISFTPQPLYPGERAPGTHWIGATSTFSVKLHTTRSCDPEEVCFVTVRIDFYFFISCPI
jgi:hypothetical protein